MLLKILYEEGSVPEKWRRATVELIFQKGVKEVTLNYRLVSLRSMVCKRLEKIIKKKDFLASRNC